MRFISGTTKKLTNFQLQILKILVRNIFPYGKLIAIEFHFHPLNACKTVQFALPAKTDKLFSCFSHFNINSFLGKFFIRIDDRKPCVNLKNFQIFFNSLCISLTTRCRNKNGKKKKKCSKIVNTLLYLIYLTFIVS